MWSLNPYRFGKLNGTSIQPHGVRTHPPSADSGRRGRRSLSGGRRLVGRSSRREPGLRSGASSDSRSRSRECSESLTGRPRPLSSGRDPSDVSVAPSLWTRQASALGSIAWRSITQGGAGNGLPCRRLRLASKAATWLILPVVICLSQRLSHACLSINCLYCETANGSLNQL